MAFVRVNKIGETGVMSMYLFLWMKPGRESFVQQVDQLSMGKVLGYRYFSVYERICWMRLIMNSDDVSFFIQKKGIFVCKVQ